jgi:hypothetical protein
VSDEDYGSGRLDEIEHAGRLADQIFTDERERRIQQQRDMESASRSVRSAEQSALAFRVSASLVAPFEAPEVVAVITTSEKYPDLQADVAATLAQVRALPSYAELVRERETVIADAKAVTVTDAATYTRADELATKLASIEDRLTDWWEPLTSFGFRFHRWLTARRGVDATEPKGERDRLLREAGVWNAEQERLKAEREAAQALLDKKAADALATSQAAVYEAQGMPELAAAIIEEAIATPAAALTLPSTVPSGVGMTHGKDWSVEIINASLVPRHYWAPDEGLILTVVKRMKGNIRIPGVKITPKNTTKGRRK